MRDYRFDYKDVINVTSNLSNLVVFFWKSCYKFVEKAIFIDANQVVYCHLPRGSTLQGVLHPILSFSWEKSSPQSFKLVFLVCFHSVIKRGREKWLANKSWKELKTTSCFSAKGPLALFWQCGKFGALARFRNGFPKRRKTCPSLRKSGAVFSSQFKPEIAGDKELKPSPTSILFPRVG